MPGSRASPWPLVEFELCRLMGWTYEELDQQPAERTLRGYRLWGHMKQGEADREAARASVRSGLSKAGK